MKKILTLILALSAALAVGAQTKSFEKFYDRYNGREGYTTIEMSGKMLKMINTDGENIDKELASTFNKVKTLTIVVVDANNDEFTSDIKRLVSGNEYELLTAINDDGLTIKFYVADGEKEFLMYVSDEDNSLILSIVGDKLTLNQVTQFTKIITVK